MCWPSPSGPYDRASPKTRVRTLRAVGFTRGQRRTTTGWLAATATGLSLAAAIPIGLIGGTLAWRVYATSLGVLPESAVPWLGLGTVVAAAFLVSAVVAVIVARGVTGAIPPHADAMAGERVIGDAVGGHACRTRSHQRSATSRARPSCIALKDA